MKTTSKDLFEILAREHASTLLVYLKSVVRDRSMVDDLFQETLLTAWKNIDSFDRARPFGPWLRGIAGKLVLVHYRRSAKGFVFCDETILDQLAHRAEQWQVEAGDSLDEKLGRLRQCLEHLPVSYRQAVDLRYREGLKGQQLADRLSLTMETVKKRLQRARTRLLECMDRRLSLSGVNP
ncbi:sigma-70 family RNA polymerase sigma factor [bacterium]|nr:sigma-70 family RNA polymerase sigma factor [bacterium]